PVAAVRASVTATIAPFASCHREQNHEERWIASEGVTGLEPPRLHHHRVLAALPPSSSPRYRGWREKEGERNREVAAVTSSSSSNFAPLLILLEATMAVQMVAQEKCDPGKFSLMIASDIEKDYEEQEFWTGGCDASADMELIEEFSL
ncbi:hypothetical protein HN51_052737, partial [Arachis hypogaea]